MDLSPAVILVSPQLGENIGAAARNMLNFGITDLRIVNPRDGWPNPQADYMAKGAISVVENATIYTSLKDAAKDINKIYAATARPRDMVKPIYTPNKTAREAVKYYNMGKKSAFMFGPERSGLENDDIAIADAISIIPVSEIYKSLNLAQAVNVFCYEWFVNLNSDAEDESEKLNANPAKKTDVINMFEHLEEELDKAGFFKVDHMKSKMINNIRNIFIRSNLSDQDVRTLRGIIKSLTNKQ